MYRNKPKVLLAASIIFFVFVTTTAYYKQNGLRDVRRLEAAIEKIRNEQLSVLAENEHSRLELESLNFNDKYVEAIARESLGLVKPGEVVYEFVDATQLGVPDLKLKGSR